MSFMIYNIKSHMDSAQIEKIINSISSKKVFISGYRRNIIKDKESRIILNLREIEKLDIPEKIETRYDLLLLIDTNKGICERDGCFKNKAKKDGWKLRKFCSRKCADIDYSLKQTGPSNTCFRMNEESKKIMGEKISKKIKQKIASGEFTPEITNSWCHSKIKVIIKDKEINVRSSWEAFFYIFNPDLSYESVRIPYFDTTLKKYRTYITDFCDYYNKKLYEIKPNKNMINSFDKIGAAKKWCSDNGYEFIIINQDWFINNYQRNIINDTQPNKERIIYLIEKMIRYEN